MIWSHNETGAVGISDHLTNKCHHTWHTRCSVTLTRLFSLCGAEYIHTPTCACAHTHTHTHWHTSIWNGNLSDTFPTFGDTVLAFPLSDSLIGGLAFQGVSPSSIRFYNGRGSLAELYFTPWALNQKRRTKEQFSERCSADSHDTDWTK